MLLDHPDASHRPPDSQVLALANILKIPCPLHVSFAAALDCAKRIERKLDPMSEHDISQQGAELTEDFETLLTMVRGLMQEYQALRTEPKVVEKFCDIARVGASIQCLLWSLNPETSPDSNSAVWSRLLAKNLQQVRQYLGAFAELEAA